ncbi:MAG TPA: trypsin-like peptidase domain-containing protein [Chloroflexia bacterium]|nr:trypsin-like peptidase domain-containing protein [Chloroflexia bacterium]
MRRLSLLLLVLLLTACGEPAATPTAIPVPTPENTATPAALSTADLVDKLRPSTVYVRAKFAESAIADEGEGHGTGIVYDATNGYVLTNAHVVEGASSIQVMTDGGGSTFSARVVGRAQCDDLAVLKVDSPRGLKAATLATNADVKIGTDVIALGYPISLGKSTDLSANPGTISKSRVQEPPYQELIQTNAVIAPGNSGGPLINRRGEVIGINSLRLRDAPGIYYAISMSYARPILKQLEKGTNRQYTGLNVRLNSYEKYYGTDKGLAIISLATGSPATQLGLQPADLLLKVENRSVNSDAEFCEILRSHTDGDRIKLTVSRVDTGQQCEGELTLGQGAGTDPAALHCVGGSSGSAGSGSSGTGESGGNSNWTRLLNSTFVGDEAGPWPVEDTGDTTWTVEDDAYVMAFTEKDSAIAYPTAGEDVRNLADGDIVADVLLDGTGYAGVLARFSYAADKTESKYACWINSSSEFGCFKTLGGKFIELKDGGKSAAVKPGEVNTLALAVVGDEITFYINSQEATTITDDSITSGAWGLYAGTNSGSFAAYYEEISIYRPK